MRGMWGFVAYGAVAAILAAGCATSSSSAGPAKPAAKPGTTAAAPGASKPGTTAAAPKPGTTAPSTAKPADAKPADAKPADAKPADAKPADAKPATAKPAEGTKPAEAKPADAKSPVTKAAETKPADAKKVPPPSDGAAAGGGFWASWDDFMKRTGQKLGDSKFLGFRIKPKVSEEIDFTDNVYYQDDHEKFIARLDGEDVNSDGRPDGDGVLAVPGLGKPRAREADIVNVFTLGADLDMPLNLSLVPVLGKDGRDSVTFFGASVTSVEYVRHGDSPDALNWQLKLDAPALLNDLLSKLKKIDASRHAFYVRAEGDYSKVTDPLDVPRFELNSGTGAFQNGGERSDFTRKEWFLKSTLGWQGAAFDAKVTYKHYRMDLMDSQLQPADHSEHVGYAEIGHKLNRSQHRVYGFYEFTKYDFDDRGNFDPFRATEDKTQALRDFKKIRTGMGWEGPVASKKIKGGAELYYLASEVYHPGDWRFHPLNVHIGTGGTRRFAGSPLTESFSERNMLGGKGNLSYRPFVTKGTQLTAAYERNVEWSVVAQDKVLDTGSITFTHPINEKLTSEIAYSMSMENLAHREKRLYNDLGLGFRYKLAAYTEAFLRYTIRHMRSRHEQGISFGDGTPGNEIYVLRANGDFTTNIVALGISVAF
jgi:hypothetical protein